MAKDITLVADSPNLQRAVRIANRIKLVKKKDGKNSLDEFTVSTEANLVLLELASVPSSGYGNGTALKITGFTDAGEKIYGDEIPVKIPRL